MALLNAEKNQSSVNKSEEKKICSTTCITPLEIEVPNVDFPFNTQEILQGWQTVIFFYCCCEK